MANRPLAVVLGGIDLLRPLGLAGIPAAVAAPSTAAVRQSRFSRIGVDWDHTRPHESQADRLEAFLASQRRPPVLLFEYDQDLLFISRCRDRLGRVARFALPEPDLVEDLVDKLRFHHLARRLDLPVPRSVVLSPDDDFAAPSDAPLPAVLKPATRSIEQRWQGLGGAAKAVAVHAIQDLDRLRPRLVEYGLPVLLQEAVQGPETRIESYHVYVDAEGRTAAEFTGRKIRTLPPTHGLTTALEITAVDDVFDAGRDVVARLGLRGVAKLDFKRTATGLKLLEVNPRFSLWNHAGALAGVNIPAVVYADLAGLPRPQHHRLRPGVRWFNRADPRAASQHGLSRLHWLAWALRARARSGLALDDPRPIAHALLASRR